MQQIRQYIRERQARFAELDFFLQLEKNDSPNEALSFVRRLAFFVMVFQDILRLNESLVQSPELRRVARHHRAEDRGHDLWYLEDLMVLDGSIPDTRELFSGNGVTRDTAYQLMSEVFGAKDDCARIALLYVLESTGHIFFTRVVTNAERVGVPQRLLYFARRHLDIELGHELFEEEMNATVERIELSPEQRQNIMALVDRSFDAMTSMLSALSKPEETRVSLPPPSAPPQSTRLNVPRVKRTDDTRRIVALLENDDSRISAVPPSAPPASRVVARDQSVANKRTGTNNSSH